MDCFAKLFSDEILQKLSKMINSFAKIKCQLNTPECKRSVVAKWKPATKAVILRYIAITTFSLDQKFVITGQQKTYIILLGLPR